MKHLKFLFLLALSVLLTTSCQRDEIEKDSGVDSSSEIELRSYNQEDCGFINSFCEERSNYVIAVHEPFEPCEWPCFTGGGDDGSSMRIMPVKIFDGSTAVFLEDNDDSYFMINSEHPAFEGKTIERTIPNEIRALLDIEYRDISDGVKVLEDIQSSNLVTLTTLDDGKFRINTNNEGGTTSALIRLCEYYRISDVNSFIEVFFDGTNNPPSFVRGFIEDAFENAENNPDCIIEGSTDSGNSKCYYDCIDPRCVIDYLLDIDAGLSDDRKNIMIAQYLGEALGLTNEEIDFLSLPSNSSFTSDLYSQLGSELNLGECENEDCSLRYSLSDIIQIEMNQQSAGITNEEIIKINSKMFCCNKQLEFTVLSQLKVDGEPLNYSTLSNLPFCDDSYLPECYNCSVGQKQKLWTAWIKARDKLECAVSKLESYNAPDPIDVAIVLQSHFNSDSQALAGFLSNILGYVRLMAVGSDYELQANGTGNCGPNTLAWSLPVIHLTDIRLCEPNFWNSTSNEQSTTLIHEWMHLYFFAGDIAYDWESDYNQLSTLEALFNADSFTELVNDLCL